MVQVFSREKVAYIVGFLGPDPGSELIRQTNPYTTGPFSNTLQSAD